MSNSSNQFWYKKKKKAGQIGYLIQRSHAKPNCNRAKASKYTVYYIYTVVNSWEVGEGLSNVGRKYSILVTYVLHLIKIWGLYLFHHIRKQINDIFFSIVQTKSW